MTPAANAEVDMSKHHALSHAQQSAILGRFPYTAEGTKLRVLCTARTEPLLRLAGVPSPRVLEHYAVPVRRTERGFLVVDTETAAARPPMGESDDELYEPGGLLHGAIPQPSAEFQPATPADRREAIHSLCEINCTRIFEIPTGPHSKIRVQVLGFEDEALPSIGEPERWVPKKPTATDVYTAAHALTVARDLAHFEKL